jgi:hypothetical protein
MALRFREKANAVVVLANLSERRRSARCGNQLAETLLLGTCKRDVVEAATIGKSTD